MSADLRVEGTTVPGGRRAFGATLDRLAAFAAERAGREAELSFLVVDDAQMQQINREQLGHDYPTDVISFPLEAEPVLMGDVVVSAETARREAAERGHPAYHELVLYAVHGVMHLLGYDDHSPDDRRRMRRAERAALKALGLPAVFGPSRGAP
ncbi:MAG: rRNA maturation RNase YbeY [Planctomycetota bacterium]|nr:rRNA maturation RNase YbeY [Planctomycetota bacterium]